MGLLQHVFKFESGGRVERHGYVRNRTWIINNGHPWPPLDNEAYVDLLLKPSENDLKVWPHWYKHLIVMKFRDLL